MKDYVNFASLSYFLSKLYEKFAKLKHTNSKSEIIDFDDLTVVSTNDGNGNVTIVTK